MTDHPSTETSPAGSPDQSPPGAAEGGTVKVGVLIRPVSALGEFLSDASAFDAAGVDALWVDGDQAPDLDGLVLASALAAVTYRARLVVTLDPADVPAAHTSRAVDTVARLSRGRLALLIGPDPAVDAGVEPATLAHGTLPSGVAVLRRVAGVPGAFETTGSHPERWVSTAAPDGREAWRAARAEAAASGAAGIVVPADPRLLDLLRNPDTPGGRSDLHLAQG